MHDTAGPQFPALRNGLMIESPSSPRRLQAKTREGNCLCLGGSSGLSSLPAGWGTKGLIQSKKGGAALRGDEPSMTEPCRRTEAHGSQRQERHEFQASLGHIGEKKKDGAGREGETERGRTRKEREGKKDKLGTPGSRLKS
jgi:hypothetical protein